MRVGISADRQAPSGDDAQKSVLAKRKTFPKLISFLIKNFEAENILRQPHPVRSWIYKSSRVSFPSFSLCSVNVVSQSFRPTQQPQKALSARNFLLSSLFIH